MESTATASKIETAELPTDAMIHIVGEKSLNTELLVEFIDRKLEFTCLFSPIENLTAALNQFPDRIHVTFIDCYGSNNSKIFRSLVLINAHRHPHCYPILYNVDPAHSFELEALRRGVRGILYANQPIENFPRAARALLKGEMWYSREILTRFIDDKDNPLTTTEEACVILTRREREIVTKLAEGYSNDDIARYFRISPNTVKTHAYNIYKKIKVSSRIQAALWLTNSS